MISDDERLVSSARAGDRSAFEALYRRHVGRVFGLCRRLAAEPSAADDLCQEAFLTAWRRLVSFRGESAFGTWLYRLTINLAVSEGRRTTRERRRQVRLDESVWDQNPQAVAVAAVGGERVHPNAMSNETSTSPSIPTRTLDVTLDLERALTVLPPVGRQVFVLHDVEGYRHAEIGGLLGIEAATSRTHLYRARRKLQEVFSQ